MARNDIVFEHAEITFRNFSGKPTAFSANPGRNFSIWLSQEQAKELSDNGWNVRMTNPTNPEYEPRPYLPVKVEYDNYPPKVVLVKESTKKMIPLDEESIKQLDYAEIVNADVVINPYNWEVNGKKGIKAYLKSMYVTIAENVLDDKYADYSY